MDKTKDGFNKLQWSMFYKDAQYVVRSNDEAEFRTLIGIVKGMIADEKKEDKQIEEIETVLKESTPVTKPQNTQVCSVHGVTMYQKSGQWGTYYAHLDKQHGWCNGRGYKDEKQY